MNSVQADVVKELIEASRLFLFDTVCEPVDGVSQCNGCGAHAAFEIDIVHYDFCPIQRLRRALHKAEDMIRKSDRDLCGLIRA